jgi:hypothetical protein
MMPRMFYIALGAAAGVLTVRRAARAVSTLTPQHVAGSLARSVQDFVADVREGMTEREDELRRALGIGDSGDEGPAGTASPATLARPADTPDAARASLR